MPDAESMFDLDRVKRISPGFWGAIAGAVGAGAVVFTSNRILGAAALGVGMFLVALKLTPCCSGCGQAKGRGCGAGRDDNTTGADPASSSSGDPGIIPDAQRSAKLFEPPEPSGIDVADLMASAATARSGCAS